MYLTNQYDANGRVSRQTLVDTGVWLYSYTLDAQGKVKSSEVTDPRGLVIKKAFNTDGYVLTDTFISGHDQLKLTFDRQAGTNLITRVTDALSRKTDYGHDACGNVTSVTRMAGTSQAATTSYTYQTASDCLATYNRLTGVTDPLNHTTGIGYDAAGNLTSIQGPIPSIPATTFGYNTAGQVTSVTNPLSKTWQFGYEYGDLNTVTDPLQRTTTRVTDYAGRLGMMENALGQRTHLEYDVLNRLRKITDPLTGKTEFTYDPNGNLLSVKDARSGTTGYAYDDNGNLTGDGVNTYTWDARDRLVSMTGANFQYDPFGRRIGKTTGGTTTQFLYDGVNPLQEIAGTTTGLLTGLGIDQVLTRTDSSGTRHLLTDALGSTVALVDPSGLVQTQYT
ncbi:MAG TPA: hypothetical protein VLE22_01295, partial [Bryobacteraceae bacterium]|nr:hypothetical protein [Bryobacteraceae bacterium]